MNAKFYFLESAIKLFDFETLKIRLLSRETDFFQYMV